MRLHRFFLRQAQDKLFPEKKYFIADTDIIHQWKHVFRFEAGDKVILLDGLGSEFLSEIKLLSKEKAEVEIIESKKVVNVPAKEVWLFVAIIKKDNFEWIVEKGTELGVAHFVPVISERSEKKNLNMERLEKIAKEASEQSGRGTLPEIHEPMKLEDALDISDIQCLKIAFHIEGERFPTGLGEANVWLRPLLVGRSEDFAESSPVGEIANKIQKPLDSSSPSSDSLGATKTPIGILVGPEGGWSDNEIALFKSKNIPIYSLGPQVLRTETAAIVIPALLLL